MFKVIITDSVYERIIETEEQEAIADRSLLYKLLNLNEMRNRIQPLVKVQKLSAAATLQLRNFPKGVLQAPSSLYILDITPSKALEIQQAYGVMCLSGEQPDISPLIDVNDVHIALEREPLNRGWDTVLDSVEDLPSNALLLTDRYLFKGDTPREGDGFANIQSILHEVLPQRFLGGEYHVTVVFNISKAAFPFEKIVNQLNRLKTKLNRNYPIMMEVLGITPNSSVYEKLHNRYIISNYFLVEAAHKLAAFNGDIGTARQTLLPLALFTESSLNGTSTSPLNAIEQTLDALRDFSASLPHLRDRSLFRYAVNGRVMEPSVGIQNRLIG